MTLTQLARKVLTSDAGTTVADADGRSELMIALHHYHLPMMDDLGVIDYDHEHHRITVPPGEEQNAHS